MSEWNPITTIPLDRLVTVKTVTGIVCLARPRDLSTRWIRREDNWGPARVSCYRLDQNKRIIGDIVATAWKD